jgi:zinc protease
VVYSPLGGRVIVTVPVQTDMTAAAITSIVANARRMRETEIGDDELARTRDGPIAALPGRFETAAGTLGQFSYLVHLGLPFTYYQDLAANLGKVDKAAVQRAAAAFLAPDQLRFVVVGDRAWVLPMLGGLTTTGGALEGMTVRVVDADSKTVR